MDDRNWRQPRGGCDHLVAQEVVCEGARESPVNGSTACVASDDTEFRTHHQHSSARRGGSVRRESSDRTTFCRAAHSAEGANAELAVRGSEGMAGEDRRARHAYRPCRNRLLLLAAERRRKRNMFLQESSTTNVVFGLSSPKLSITDAGLTNLPTGSIFRWDIRGSSALQFHRVSAIAARLQTSGDFTRVASHIFPPSLSLWMSQHMTSRWSLCMGSRTLMPITFGLS
jgi:hypothetical protein